jgi:methionyl-tRNA formyltransferase
MRIIFMGTAELSCASLEALARDPQFQLAAVVTQPDRPRGRELKRQPSPVKEFAQKLNLPVLEPERVRDEQFIVELRGLAPELIVVAAYGQILPPAILDLPRHGCLNVHTSLLPKHRGAAPIQWALAKGDAETGVTIMKMDAGLDTGDIIAQRRTPADDSTTLHDRLARLGAELLLATIPDFVAGKIQPRPQPAAGASHAPKIKKEDGHIDWNLPAQTIVNRLRAFTPWPGVFTFLRGARTASRITGGETETRGRAARAPVPGEVLPPPLLKIWKAEPAEKSGEAGTILSADKNGIVVACGQNALRILELQREGGRRMSAVEFLAGHPLKVGEKFEA